jgi:hypothetical protein
MAIINHVTASASPRLVNISYTARDSWGEMDNKLVRSAFDQFGVRVIPKGYDVPGESFFLLSVSETVC